MCDTLTQLRRSGPLTTGHGGWTKRGKGTLEGTGMSRSPSFLSPPLCMQQEEQEGPQEMSTTLRTYVCCRKERQQWSGVSYSLASLHPGHDERLGLGPKRGDDGGSDLADVGDDRESEGDADDGKEDTEDSAARRHRGDVAVAHCGDDCGGEEYRLHVRPLVRALKRK